MIRPLQPLGSAPPTLQPPTLQPLTLELHLEPERQGAAALRPAILAALSAHGRPLRWAITATAGGRLVIEAILVVDGGG